MVATLNPDYELIYIDREDDKVFLKNQFFKNMVSLSTVEYEIIRYYSENPDPQRVFEHFSAQYEMPPDFIYLLVQKAEASGLLMSDGYLQRKEKVLATSGKRLNTWLFLLIDKVKSLLQAVGLNAKLELRGSFKYYRLLSFDLENTWLEKLCAVRVIQHVFVLVYMVSLLVLLYGLFSLPGYQPAWDFARIGNSQGVLPLLVLFAAVGIVSFLHEIGHFILYKKFGGVTSEMGIALMTGIIPTLYVTTSSLPLWKRKYQRILVMAGGVIVDILLLVAFLYVGYAANSGVLSFYAFIFSFMQAYRIYFNVNPFIPRTDGYFIMCDILSNPTFHSTAYTHASGVFQKIKTLQFNTVSGSEVAYACYFILSILFMIINYLVMLLPLIFVFS